MPAYGGHFTMGKENFLARIKKNCYTYKQRTGEEFGEMMKKIFKLSIWILLLLCALSACTSRVPENEPRIYADGAVINISVGTATKTFTVEVVDAQGNQVTVTVKTDLETVGEVLQKAGLLQGEQGEFGLYIKTVNGITADYEKDGTYWAFYENGQYALTGVDLTQSADGAVYRFAVETM